MLEPATTIVPCVDECKNSLSAEFNCFNCPNNKKNFLHLVKELCFKEGALFILDEMITGFRWHLNGGQTFFGVEPDLSTFGKGMGNGFAISAIIGKEKFMNVGGIDTEGSERTFLLSTTHGSEMSALGALSEVIDIYKSEDICGYLWKFGKDLREGINSMVKKFHLEENFEMIGPDICLNYLTKDRDNQISLGFRTLFSQEMINNGVLMPWIAQSFSHREEELEITMKAISKSFEVYSQALNEGLSKYLKGPVIKPVFRKYN
jgi:glutamate-1-semialdehyde 2,1-aminomutase